MRSTSDHGRRCTASWTTSTSSAFSTAWTAVTASRGSRSPIPTRSHHHHHAVNEDTGEITAFSDPVLEASILAIADRLGLELTGHDVILRGRPRAMDPADSER